MFTEQSKGKILETLAVLSLYQKSKVSRKEETETKSTSFSSQNPLVKKQNNITENLKIMKTKSQKVQKAFI